MWVSGKKALGFLSTFARLLLVFFICTDLKSRVFASEASAVLWELNSHSCSPFIQIGVSYVPVKSWNTTTVVPASPDLSGLNRLGPESAPGFPLGQKEVNPEAGLPLYSRTNPSRSSGLMPSKQSGFSSSSHPIRPHTHAKLAPNPAKRAIGLFTHCQCNLFHEQEEVRRHWGGGGVCVAAGSCQPVLSMPEDMASLKACWR